MSATVGDFSGSGFGPGASPASLAYPGDGINGLLGALQRRKGDIEFVQVRHEEMAAFMASAHAKFTGELGVCLATSGPGASHLLTGLYDARLDHMPVLAIVGQQARTAVGAHYQQELDLESLFKDVAGTFVKQAMVPGQVRHLVDRAVRMATGERRVTALIFPNDLQEMPYEEPPRVHGAVFSGVGYTKPRVVPYEADLRRAAEVLNAGSKVAILVGAGALHATDEVIEVAEMIGLRGIFVDDPESLGAAWDEALASPVPVVLEVRTDPEVPPMPPHITFKQIRKPEAEIYRLRDGACARKDATALPG